MSDNFQILACLKSDELGASLRSALQGARDLNVEVKVGDIGGVAPKLVNGSAPNLLLVDLSLENSNEIPELAQIISRKQGQMAVVATAKEADLNSVRTLMRMGFTDFIPQPFNPQDLLNAVAAIRARIDHQIHVGGSVISYLASGGGAGATSLAIQTAADLLTGAQKERARVCLVDFDVQMGNIAISLDIQSEVGLQTIIDNPDRLDDEFMAGAVSHHKSGIDVLTAPNKILPLEILTPELIDHVLSWARRNYDYVIVDLPSNWASWTSLVLEASDMIMLVTEISVTGAQRCQRHFNLLADQQLDDIPLAVIANRAKSGFGFKSTVKQFETALGRKISCCVRSDFDTANAAREEGVLLDEIKRRSRIAKDLHAFLVKVRPALAVAREARTKNIIAHRA